MNHSVQTLSTQDKTHTKDRVAVYSRHMPALDGMRGLAILLVVWHNVSAGGYGGGGIFEKAANILVNAGWVGVQLFFVLSGFLITGLLLDEKGQPHHLRNFFMRRVLRIFPLYYLVLAFSLLLVPLTGWNQDWIAGYQDYGIWYWTYLANWVSVSGHITGFQHFWSLAVEEQYYLLWPACVLLMGTKSLLRLCFILVVFAMVFRFAVYVIADPDTAYNAAYQFTCARWDALAIGSMCAIIVRHARLGERIPYLSLTSIQMSVAYVLLFVAIYHNFAPTQLGIGALNQTMCAIGFGGWILSSIYPSHTGIGRWNHHLLTLPWLRLVGKYSYAIYIFHFPMKIMSESMWMKYHAKFTALGGGMGATVHALLIFAGSYVMALISWQLLEKPLLKWKRYYYAKPVIST